MVHLPYGYTYNWNSTALSLLASLGAHFHEVLAAGWGRRCCSVVSHYSRPTRLQCRRLTVLAVEIGDSQHVGCAALRGAGQARAWDINQLPALQSWSS